MAGLSCAGRLAGSGQAVEIFDKGRGPGGRMSTRRMTTSLGEMRWDHGAQFFTARNPDFVSAVKNWVDAGAVKEWTGQFLDLGGGAEQPDAKQDTRYVGAPSMNSVIRHMARDLSVQWARRVSAILKRGDAWQLQFEDGAHAGPFSAVLVAVPAEQAVDLLKDAAPGISAEAAAVRSAPCWAIMLGFDAPLQAGFDGARITGSPLSWIARNASKPGRAALETWVLHASPDWSREHLEEQSEEVAAKLIRNFCAMSGAQEPVFSAAHRWRYAMSEKRSGSLCSWNADTRVGACGDWFIAPRVESAWLSGQALAREILGTN